MNDKDLVRVQASLNAGEILTIQKEQHKMIFNVKKMAKEDPEKVKAFLNDVITDPEFPPEVKNAAQRLLDIYNTNPDNIYRALKKGMKSLMTDAKHTLEQQPKTS